MSAVCKCKSHDTEEEIENCYSKLSQEEEEINKELETLMARKCHFETKAQNIIKVLPNLETILTEAKQLAEMVSYTTVLAEKVSSKVRKLDVARSRVSECQQRVHDLLDLQLCSDGVQVSLQSDDYEKAAAHIHRYLSMDQRLLEKTADDMQQDCTSVSNSISLLKDAELRLQKIITNKFNESVTKEDTASVERFFKLFPLLRMHDYGLEKYSKYLAKKVEMESKKTLKSSLENTSDKRANVIFADTITLLFEDIARNIEIHQPLVETYYGPGHILKLAKILQQECDRQAKCILNEFRKRRNINKLIGLIQEYNKNISSTLTSTSSLSATTNRLDPKDVDQILGEITIVQSRYNLYMKFLRKKIELDIETADGNTKQKVMEMEKLFKDCELCTAMQDLLSQYLLLEHYYMDESVRKAVAMDTVESGSLISSMIDDIFFIVKKCIRRAASTGNVDGVCTIVNNACGVLETQMCTTLMHSMRQGFPSGYLDLTQAYNVMIQGKLQTSDTEQAKTLFLSHLNNTDIGAEYVGTLCSGLVEEVSNELDKAKLASCLSGLSVVTAGLGIAQELGLTQLRQVVVKPRVSPWIDGFSTLSHCLTEEEFSSYEANEPFIRTLIANLNSLLTEFKTCLTPSNYDSLVSIVANETSMKLEKVIIKSEFNRLGGLTLDKEIRSLVSYLSKSTSWSVREKFLRLTQIANILNLETVSEISDYSGSMPLRITNNEIKKILKLRIDFKMEDINRIKL